jgi:hypothetical protein
MVMPALGRLIKEIGVLFLTNLRNRLNKLRVHWKLWCVNRGL